jgi:hypothetical protein
MQAASTEGDGGRRPDRGDALVALLVAVALFGLFVADYGSSWRWVREVPAEEAARRHDFIHSIDHSPITHNLRRLGGSVRPWSLIHWSGGPDPVGILALARAILASVAAWVLARPDPAPRESRVDSPAHAVTPVP